MEAVIGVDAGNTKTAVIAVTTEGNLVAHTRSNGSNYQTVGVERARVALLDAIIPVAHEVANKGLNIVAMGFGLTGLDRPKDHAVLKPMTDEIVEKVAAILSCPMIPSHVVLNDAYLVLRAGTDDDVGIAVSSGTGGNCVGRNKNGCRVQIGGLASELGDGGGAHDIAMMGLRAAGRARDGRAWRTSITDKIVSLLGLGSIEDVLDFAIPGNAPKGYEEASPPQAGILAPLVFEAAAEGDLVAIEILIEAGRQLGKAAKRVGTILFGHEDSFPVVLGGSVLMYNPDSFFARAIVAEIQMDFPGARSEVLEFPPVVGAALLALDQVSAQQGREYIRQQLINGELRKKIGEQMKDI